MKKIMIELISDLKNAGFRPTCFSCKKDDGTSNGKATEDCDIAIDLSGEHSAEKFQKMFGNKVTVTFNPYDHKPGGTFSLYNTTRLKFTV